MANKQNLDAAVSIYLSNVNMIQASCQTYNVKCFFILQPLIMTKEPLGEVEQIVLNNIESHPRFGPDGIRFMRDFYEAVNQTLADDRHFINASDALDGRSQSDFYDAGHLGIESPPVVGMKTASMILERLQEEQLTFDNMLPRDHTVRSESDSSGDLR